jgi:hypothetical protein
LGNRVFALRNVKVNHSGGRIIAENKADDLFPLGKFEGDIAAIVESGLQSVVPSLWA